MSERTVELAVGGGARPTSRAVEARLRAVRLHQLEGFFHVALHAGFARAAAAMPYPITEPALHQQVRKLERALGVLLLVRGPARRMVLTPEGRQLHAFITPYFERLPGVLRELAGASGGELVLAVDPIYVEALAAGVLGDLRSAAPGARLRLVELEVPDLVRELGRGAIDLGLCSIGSPPVGLHFEGLGALGVELLVPAGHRLAKKRILGMEDLADVPLLVYAAGSEGRRFTDEAMRRIGLTIQVAAEASSASALRAMARAGVGPAIVPSLGRPRRRRTTGRDGLVVIDVTDVVDRVVGLPQFGLLRRAGPALSGLAAAFSRLARARFAGPRRGAGQA